MPDSFIQGYAKYNPEHEYKLYCLQEVLNTIKADHPV